ncbi:MAG TPA: aminodeoxychorismate/anthranilate synthase component II [Frankiaceae bacterium]|nr:aminodeoxychorismate/anthranilate synthase component II [Frankiaceae bacterium]
MSRILVVDNYDSFVFNLVQYLGQLGAECIVRRNDEVAPDEVAELGVDGVLLSPGPGHPDEAGVSVPMVRHCAQTHTPMLGVCLGHQALGVAFGGRVSRAPELLHGKTSLVSHPPVGNRDSILVDLPEPFVATRYHSLAVDADSVPAELEVTAVTGSGVVMGLRHRTLPLEGVQFHPESVLTQGGHLMLARWLADCGDPSAVDRAPELSAEMDGLRATAFAS